jgi:uncharacterized membrane protein
LTALVIGQANKTTPIAANHGIPGLGLIWPVLAIGYLMASASGYRSVALALVGMMVGILVMVSGRRMAGAIVALGLSGACFYWSDSLLFVAYLPPLVGFSFMAFFFLRTLRPGSEPLITRVARKEHPDLPAEIAVYTRTLTWIWVGCFALLLVVALLLAPILLLPSWSRWTQGLAVAVPATLFLGEYVYRHHHLRDYPHASLPTLLLNIIAVIKEVATGTPPAGPAVNPEH